MKLETIKKNKRKKIIIGSMIVLSVVGCLTLTTTRAKYKSVQSIKLASGIVKYKASDLHLVAIKVSEDGTNYSPSSTIPEGNYTFNRDKSKCRIPTGTLTGENAPVASGVTMEFLDNKINILGVSEKDTKCYIYFDKVLDAEVPTISNVATEVTQTEITVTVTASDNIGVTEYYYQLDSGDYIKETTNTHTFAGLQSNTLHAIKVYVKDAAGNTSVEITKENIKTEADVVVINGLGSGNFEHKYTYNGLEYTLSCQSAQWIIPIGVTLKAIGSDHWIVFFDDQNRQMGTNSSTYTITGKERKFRCDCGTIY